MYVNPSREWEYIRKMTELNNQVKKQQMVSGIYSLKSGTRVRVYLDYGKRSAKHTQRRMNFDRTGTFLRNENCNGVVRLDELIDDKADVELQVYFITHL